MTLISLMRNISFVQAIHLRFISWSKLSVRRASRPTLRMPTFDSSWYRLNPFLLFSFREHVERDLDHVLGWIGSEPFWTSVHTFKQIHTFHCTMWIRMQMTSHRSFNTETWLLFVRRTLLLLLLHLRCGWWARPHIDNNAYLFFPDIRAELLN